MPKSIIDKEYCKGCMLCVDACPLKLIKVSNEMNKKGVKIAEFDDKEGKCTGCKMCATMCPEACIEIEK